MPNATPYNDAFYAETRHGSRSSADAILPDILEAVRPQSVVDVGCGIGTWLAVAIARGVEDVIGLDGDWVSSAALEIPAAQFQRVDLRQPLKVDRRFDLAICMETAEHLPSERSAGLVGDMVALAPVVLFSAAIPFQGGVGHINERWPDFWSDLFAAHHYRSVDAIRWRYWSDARVQYWYPQNGFLYVADGVQVDIAAPVGMPRRVVHPEHLARLVDPRLIGWRLASEALVWRARRAGRRIRRH
jgi:SAM-dependent methyltransferase